MSASKSGFWFTNLPILRPHLPALLGDSHPKTGALSEIPHPLNSIDTTESEHNTTVQSYQCQLSQILPHCDSLISHHGNFSVLEIPPPCHLGRFSAETMRPI